MAPIAAALAEWAYDLVPGEADREIAQRSLRDTVAVTLAAASHPINRIAAHLGEGGRWAVAGHILDFDDLHMESTTHVSVVTVPAVVASGGDEKAYLGAAGVMARLGMALGWDHYSVGWHATCTAGAPAAAVGAGLSMGLNPTQLATAIALALPGAGGVQRAFGSDGKSLQVGFAVASGIRAAHLAAAGATADLEVLEEWLALVGGDANRLDLSGPAIPGGLAIKVYPACYALQRPISALADLSAGSIDPSSVTRIVLRTMEGTVTPLIHHRPTTGLQAKFSIEYAAATALMDAYSGFDCFTDEAVRRPQAQRLIGLVEVQLEPGGIGLLDGSLDVELHTDSGQVLHARQEFPPGSPTRPPTDDQFAAKLSDCLSGLGGTDDLDPGGWTWEGAAGLLRSML